MKKVTKLGPSSSSVLREGEMSVMYRNHGEMRNYKKLWSENLGDMGCRWEDIN
jgi:hypothetical protein